MISKSRVSVFWKALVSSRATAEQHPLAVLLDRLLEVADQGDPIAQRSEDVVLEAQRLAAVGTDQLLLDQVDHAGLELVDEIVDRGVGVVEVEAERSGSWPRWRAPTTRAAARSAGTRRP